MIYVMVHGRLGNQMFQYAFARRIQLETNEPIMMNFTKVTTPSNSEKGWGNDLKYFNVNDFIVDDNTSQYLIDKSTIKQKTLIIPYMLLNKLFSLKGEDSSRKFCEKWQPLLNKNGVFSIKNGYYTPSKSKTNNIIINGHFENANFYTSMKDILRKEFTPKNAPLDKNAKLYETIISNESVCVSIRRGDFTTGTNKSIYNICSPEYFYNAMKEIKKHIPNAKFIIFSDDVDWIRENMDFPFDVDYETEGNPVWEKLRLMYSCKHFVLSNSSFSWWPQYLCDNPNKVVVSPDRWKNFSQYCGLIEKSFITLKV